MARLGGSSFVISPGQGTWLLETRDGVVMDGAAAEHVREAIPVLAGYVDALGIRSFAGGTDLAADLADSDLPRHGGRRRAPVVPLINLESAIDHPCQALADWKTLDDLGVPARGGKFVLSWAWHPKPLPLAVPAAAVHMAALRGMDVTVLRPDGFALPEPVMARARAAAELSGGSLRETADRGEALAGAQVLYAKSWTVAAPLRRPRGRGGASAPASATGASDDELVRGPPRRTAGSCTACRCGATWWSKDAVLDGPRSVVVHEARQPHVGADGGAPPSAARR